MLKKRNLKKGLALSVAFLAFGLFAAPEARAQARTCPSGTYLAEGGACAEYTEQEMAMRVAEIEAEIEKAKKELEALKEENKKNTASTVDMLELLKKLFMLEEPQEGDGKGQGQGDGGPGGLLGQMANQLLGSAAAKAMNVAKGLFGKKGGTSSQDNVLNTNVANIEGLMGAQLDSLLGTVNAFNNNQQAIGSAGPVVAPWAVPGMSLDANRSFGVSYFPSTKGKGFTITKDDLTGGNLHVKLDKSLIEKYSRSAEDSRKMEEVNLGLLTRAHVRILALSWNVMSKNAMDNALPEMALVIAAAGPERHKVVANSRVELEAWKFLMQTAYMNAGYAEMQSVQVIANDGKM